MSNIVINGKTYNGVESITVNKSDGGTAKYTEGERPAGTIEITENGPHDVTNYASANVNVPIPEPNLQEKIITQNGEVVADEGYDGLSKVNVNVFSGEYSVNSVVNENGNQTLNIVKTGTDRLQWKCDNMKSLAYEFTDYKGTDLSILEGLDTSQVTDMQYMLRGCRNMTKFPAIDTSNVATMTYMCSNNTYLTDVTSLNTQNATDLDYTFQGCGSLQSIELDLGKCEKLSNTFHTCSSLKSATLKNLSVVKNMSNAFYRCEDLTDLSFVNCDTSNVTDMSYAFYRSKLIEIPYIDIRKTTNLTYIFYSCRALETAQNLDLINKPNIQNSFLLCEKLTNLTLKNIQTDLQIGSSTSWGHLLTNASLLNTAQELWDNTGNTLGGTRTLRMATASKTAIQSIYVKLVDVTDDMIAQDQYIANKKPCVECASTDEGAMTVEEYIISKGWSIA